MDFLKQCPLLICVLLTSLLIPWELLKKEDDSQKAAPTTVAKITTVATEAATTAPPANDGATPDSSETAVSGSDLTTTTVTTEAAGEYVPLANADESYFEDALFIGNSRTVGMYLFGDMPESTDFFADVGMTIYDVLDANIDVPPESGSTNTLTGLLTAKQYGKIYIMFGINELGTGTSESFVEYYQSVVQQICQMQPDAIVYVQSIINVAASAETDVISNANINEKNALLSQIADNKQVFYIDLNPSLVDSSGYLNSDYTSDGIHLGGSALPLWKDCLLANAMQKNSGAGAAGGATTTVATTLDAAAPAEEDSEANPE